MDEQQFGRYSLLRRLSQDAFGSLYRAGLVADGGVAELVLLRTFDIPSADREAVEQLLANSSSSGGSSSLPSARDRGVIDGTAFLAYPYVSGRTMRDLLQELDRRGTTMPAEHCLFLADRISTTSEALAKATGSSGLVFPETVYLSNDGDVQILGRELAGETITALAGSLGLDDYLAPEVSGGKAKNNDDVYAISALLRKTLGDGAPNDVRDLINQGQSAADQRPSLESWKTGLQKIASQRGESSSAFNVAFFLHGLLINEIEEDTRRIEAEKTALGGAPESSPSAVEPTAKATAQSVTSTPTQTAEKRTALPMPLILAAGIGALALLGYLGWSMFGPSNDASTNGQTQSAPVEVADVGTVSDPQLQQVGPEADQAPGSVVDSEAESGPAVSDSVASDSESGAADASNSADVPSSAPAQNLTQPATRNLSADGSPLRISAPDRYSPSSAGSSVADRLPEPPPSDAELEEQIQQLATAKAAEAEASIREEYQANLDALEERLQQAQETQKQQEKERLAAIAAEEEKKRLAEEAAAALKAEQEKAAEEAAAKAAAAEAAKAKAGDLVSEGPGVTVATMTKRPSPDFPRMAQRMGRDATVTVRILVDEFGKVADVQLVGEKSGFGFDEAALAAARDTEWKAGSKDGVNVKMWRSIRIVFDPSP